MKTFKLLFLLLFVASFNNYAQDNYLGDGPFNQLIIRGVMLVNGDGSPPRGPVDIVVENNTIIKVQVVGYPGVEIKESGRPKLKKGGKELNANGMYLDIFHKLTALLYLEYPQNNSSPPSPETATFTCCSASCDTRKVEI